MYNDQIVRLTAGPINKINDEVIGGMAGINGVSKFKGQLGAGFYQDDNELLYDSSMGIVYGGHFRYVRLAAAATAVVRGQIVFWNSPVDDAAFEVTTSEAGSADTAMLSAGIVLNSGWTPGFYSVVQDIGNVFVKFRAALTSAGAIGSRVFCAGVGAGVDNGFADVIDSANPTLFSDVSKMFGRYLGVASVAPVNGGVTLVNVNFHNVR